MTNNSQIHILSKSHGSKLDIKNFLNLFSDKEKSQSFQLQSLQEKLTESYSKDTASEPIINNEDQESDKIKKLKAILKNLEKYFDPSSENHNLASPKELSDLIKGLQELKEKRLNYPPIIAGSCFYLHGDKDLAKVKMELFCSQEEMKNLKTDTPTRQNDVNLVTDTINNMLTMEKIYGADHVRGLERRYIDDLRSLREGEKKSEQERGAAAANKTPKVMPGSVKESIKGSQAKDSRIKGAWTEMVENERNKVDTQNKGPQNSI